ncbi:TolC family protein [Thorsellia kenyensis]|uniref:TolC family protein n=1 Tax=Thorsellia kenyensis TaxID=1549888 RepID=A0ABV6CF37_9GAMM
MIVKTIYNKKIPFLLLFSLSSLVGCGSSENESSSQAIEKIPLKGSQPQNSQLVNKQSANSQSAATGSKNKGANYFSTIKNNPLWIFMHNTALVSLDVSPEISQAESNALGRKDQIDVVKGQRYPQVNLSTSSPRLEVGKSNKDNNTVTSQVSVVTPVFDWGRISSQVEEQSYAFEASNMGLRLKQDEIAYTILSYAVEIARVTKLLDVNEAYLTRMNELVAMLEGIVAADPGRASELLQAKTKQIQALTSRDSLIAQLNELQVSAERYLGEEIYFPKGLDFDPEIFDQVDEEPLIKFHPAVLQANAEYNRAKAAAKSLGASRLPQVNLNVTKNTNDLEYEDEEDPWLVGLNLSWAVYEGGSATASERSAIQEAKTILYQRQTIVKDIQNRISAARVQRDNAILRSKEYQNLVDASREVKQTFFDQWFHLGKKQLLDVLSAESDFYNNEQTLVNLEFDAFSSQLRLFSDSGLLLSWLDITLKQVSR